jgi:transcriptional regulator with XRE-family HTH domain
MTNSTKSQIVHNITRLTEASGLSDIIFADILGLSIRKVRYLKNGTGNLKLNDIENIAVFFGISVSSLSKNKLKISHDLREKLFEKYRNNTEYRVHFEETPTMAYAIKFVLLNYVGFEQCMEIKDIKTFFKAFKWDFKSSALSHALSRYWDVINISSHPKKKRTKLYCKRKVRY